MNKVILMGRLTRDPEVRYGGSDTSTAIARYTLAVDRRGRRDENGQSADFIGCVAFGKSAEFAEKYLKQGTKIIITGRIQTGRYTNRDGQKVYTTDVIVDEQEFAESRASASESTGFANSNNAGNVGYSSRPSKQADTDGFMSIPAGIDEELPFL